MKAISLFAGIGAFELAMQEAGIKTVLSCEIDKYAAKVLEHHFPATEVYCGDVRKLTGEYIENKYGNIDIITGGVPCQSWSIAGNREGFDDDRGNLWFEYIRLLKELQPTWAIGENVRGLISHNNGDSFELILEKICESGYAIDFDVYNSKNFGVPQNRERVFIYAKRLDKCQTIY